MLILVSEILCCGNGHYYCYYFTFLAYWKSLNLWLQTCDVHCLEVSAQLLLSSSAYYKWGCSLFKHKVHINYLCWRGQLCRRSFERITTAQKTNLQTRMANHNTEMTRLTLRWKMNSPFCSPSWRQCHRCCWSGCHGYRVGWHSSAKARNRCCL